MSENKQPGSGKIIRTSSGSTRLTAGSAKGDQKSSSGSGQSSNSGGGSKNAGRSSDSQTVVAPPAPSAAPKAAPKPSRSPQSAPTGSGPVAPTQANPAVSGSGPSAQATNSGPNTVRASSGGVKMGVKNVMNKGNKKKGPRTVRLTVSAVDPWSVMKMSFLMSVAIGVATVVAFIVLWLVLQATGVISGMESTLTEVADGRSAERIIGLFSFGRVVAAGFIIAVINIVLMTALSTLGAFLYNIGSMIAGGFHLTLTDD